MIVIVAECLKKGFFSEYMGVANCSLVPVFDETLLSYQLKNFVGLKIDKVFVECSTKADFNETNDVFLIEFNNLSMILKSLLALPKDTPVILIKNNCYFEFNTDFYDNKGSFCSLYSNEYDNPFMVYVNAEAVIKEITAFENLLNLFNEKSKKDCCSSYFKELTGYKSYLSLLFDILNRKTVFHPPLIADKIFTDEQIPEGDYTIIPPVFFKKGVQIESGAIIGPNSILMNDVVIGKNSFVRYSALMNDVFVSSGCYVNGSLLCENATVKRNGSVFEGSVLGVNSVLGESFIAENNSKFKPNVKTDRNLKKLFIADCGDKENLFGFYNLTPEKSALLGSAIGMVFEGLSVGVASDGSHNSLSVKLSLLGGLISVGADCTDFGNYYNSRIFFDTLFCDLDYCIFISGGNSGTNIAIYSGDFSPIGNSSFYNILNAVKHKNFNYCSSDNCKGVKQIKGLGKMYLRLISAMFSKPLKYKIICKTDNVFVNKMINDALLLIGENKDSKEIIKLCFNTTATKVYFEYKKKTISYNKLLRFSEFWSGEIRKKESGYSEIYGRIKRFDSVFLSFFVLSVLNDSSLTITELFDKLPQYFIYQKTFSGSLKSTDFIKFTNAGSDVFCKNDTVFVEDKKIRAGIKRINGGEMSKISVKTADFEACEEFISNFQTTIGST